MAGIAAYLVAIALYHRSLVGRAQVVFRYVAAVLTVVGYFFVIHQFVEPKQRAIDITKALIAVVAAGAVFYEQHRAGQRRPVAERWKKFIGITLGLAAVSAYFEGFNFGYSRFYHRHDQYHYYMGAKYFPEMGYDGLYRCTAIAEDELGVVRFNSEDDIGAGNHKLDLTAEVHHADWKIRNLGGDNLLMPVADVLAHPEDLQGILHRRALGGLQGRRPLLPGRLRQGVLEDDAERPRLQPTSGVDRARRLHLQSPPGDDAVPPGPRLHRHGAPRGHLRRAVVGLRLAGVGGGARSSGGASPSRTRRGRRAPSSGRTGSSSWCSPPA